MRQLHALLMPSRQLRGGLPAHGTRRSNDVGFLRIRHPQLRCLTWTDLQRAFVHPETGTTATLVLTVGAYAWHGRHHLAHIERLAAREGWGR